MKIEVYGPCNDDGSSHPLWTFEIDPGCQRVLVTLPGFVLHQTQPDVWGFKDDQQVYSRLEEHDPAIVITA